MRVLRRFSVLMAVLTMVGVGVAGSSSFQSSASTIAVLHSTMLPGNEVPGPGDPNGTGSTVVMLNAGTGQVCYVIRVDGLSAPITAGHIHIGNAGIAGPVVVPFPLKGNGHTFSGCTTAAKSLVQSIVNNPSGYYTNVHNPVFPAGAIRGQLSSVIPTPV